MGRWIWIKRVFYQKLEKLQLSLLSLPKEIGCITPRRKASGFSFVLILLYLCLLLPVVGVISFPYAGYTKVYKWVDKKGELHFTDNISHIPQDVNIEEIKPLIPKPSSPASRTLSTDKVDNPRSTTATDKPSKDSWQEKLISIQKKIEKKKAEEQSLIAELKRPKYKLLVRRERLLRKDLQELREEIARLEQERQAIVERIEAYDN